MCPLVPPVKSRQSGGPPLSAPWKPRRRAGSPEGPVCAPPWVACATACARLSCCMCVCVCGPFRARFCQVSRTNDHCAIACAPRKRCMCICVCEPTARCVCTPPGGQPASAQSGLIPHVRHLKPDGLTDEILARTVLALRGSYLLSREPGWV